MIRSKRTSWLLLVSLVFGASCELPQVCPAGEPPPTPPPDGRRDDAGYFAYAHSHNDYLHSRPLADALELRFRSVEADVFFRGGDVRVGHDADALVGTLAALYLDPLRERVAAMGGSVYGDGAPFTLWIDLKEDASALRDGLRALLDAQPGLSIFDEDGVHEAAITVILTGDAAAKRRLTAQTPRPFARDENSFRLEDAPHTALDPHIAYALDWSQWVGHGDAVDQQQRMSCIIGKAHADGRLVRFFHAPDQMASWSAQLDGGADFVGTDALTDLAAYLRTRP